MGNPITLDFSKAQPLAPANPSATTSTGTSVTLDFSKAQKLAPAGEDDLTRMNRQMTAALSGQTTTLSDEEKQQAETGKAAGFKAAAVTAAGGAIAAPLGAASVATEQVGTGILDSSGQEIMREVMQSGPSLGRQALTATARWVAQNPGKAAAAYQLADIWESRCQTF